MRKSIMKKIAAAVCVMMFMAMQVLSVSASQGWDIHYIPLAPSNASTTGDSLYYMSTSSTAKKTFTDTCDTYKTTDTPTSHAYVSLEGVISNTSGNIKYDNVFGEQNHYMAGNVLTLTVPSDIRFVAGWSITMEYSLHSYSGRTTTVTGTFSN